MGEGSTHWNARARLVHEAQAGRQLLLVAQHEAQEVEWLNNRNTPPHHENGGPHAWINTQTNNIDAGGSARCGATAAPNQSGRGICCVAQPKETYASSC